MVRIQQSTILSIDSSFKDDGIAAVGAGSELTRHSLSSPACDADKTEFTLKHAVKLPTEGELLAF